MTIRMIAGVSQNGVIGITKGGVGVIPWSYPADLKRFKERTMNSTIIMGRTTWESIGRALPARSNIVISRTIVQNNKVLTCSSIGEALAGTREDVWLIGGEGIFREGMKYADEIDVTIIPKIVEDSSSVRFPWINPMEFRLASSTFGEDGMIHLLYARPVSITK
jgi:dihydrofolate reductase